MLVTYHGTQSKLDGAAWSKAAPRGEIRTIATCGLAPDDTYACVSFVLADVPKAELMAHAEKNLIISAQAYARIKAGWKTTSVKAAETRRKTDVFDAITATHGAQAPVLATITPDELAAILVARAKIGKAGA